MANEGECPTMARGNRRHPGRSRAPQKVQGGAEAADSRVGRLWELSPDPLVAIGADGRIAEANEAMAEATGIGREELLGSAFADHFTDPARAEALCRQALAGDAVRDFGLGLRHRTARVTDVLWNARLDRGIGGVVAGARDVTERKRQEAREQMRALVLEKLTHGTPLGEVLSIIVRGIESERQGMIASILLLDAEGRHLVHGAAPGLPRFYNEAIHGVAIGPGVGSCGTAAATGLRVIVEDIQHHPYWRGYRELAARAGVAACWSEPIRDRRGRVIGTFAIYHGEPYVPTPEDIQLVEYVANLTGVVIEYHQVEAARLEAEEKVRSLNASLEQRVQHRTRELAESDKRFKLLFDTMLQGVVYQGADGRILSVNPAAVRILGASAETLLGTTSADHERNTFREDGTVFPAMEHPPMVALATGREVRNVVMGFVNPREQALRWINVSAVPLFHGDDPKPCQVYTVFDDITERRQTEERMRDLNEQLVMRAQALEQANKELESFSYSVSHDLRAPLRSIDGFSRILLEDYADKLDADGRKNLETVRAATQRMGHLIDDMLTLARVTRAQIRRTPIDLSALAHAVVADLRKTSPERDAEVVIEPDLQACADPVLIRNVLENLLDNAWKFTSRQPAARIEFGRTEQDGTPAYFVRDNGAGFDPKYTHKLFGAFQRLHSAAEFPGTGIGLATIQRIIHRHGGRVWAEGEAGKGATFFFTLSS